MSPAPSVRAQRRNKVETNNSAAQLGQQPLSLDSWKPRLGQDLIEVGEFAIADFAKSPQNCVIVNVVASESREVVFPAWFVAKQFGPPDGSKSLKTI